VLTFEHCVEASLIGIALLCNFYGA